FEGSSQLRNVTAYRTQIEGTRMNNPNCKSRIANAASLVFLLYLLCSLKAAADDFFSKDYRVGEAPVAVAVGDFNGDGKQDLAMAMVLFNRQYNSISNSSLGALGGEMTYRKMLLLISLIIGMVGGGCGSSSEETRIDKLDEVSEESTSCGGGGQACCANSVCN